MDGGCLRVDFGRVFEADEVEITCFAIREPVGEVPAQTYTERGSYSSDLALWQESGAAAVEILDRDCRAPVVKGSIHSIFYAEGDRVRVTYRLDGGEIRYFRLPHPMDRIYSIRLLKDGQELTLNSPAVNNLQAPYGAKNPVALQKAVVTLPEVRDGDYIAVAMNGIHGDEGAYCVAEVDGKRMGFPDRAPAYQSNVWEFCVTHSDRNYTYYLPLTADLSGKEVCIRALLCDSEHIDLACDVWVCPGHAYS